MKVATKLKLAVVLGLLLAVPIALQAEKAVAHNGEDHTTAQGEQRQENQREQSNQRAPQLGKYIYTAQSGDSFTLMARKAAQTYGKKFNVKLSPADIIFVETNLTKAAGWPQLNQGQQIEIDETQVKTWVDQAAALTDAQEAAWNHYVQFVGSFNTDHVGQAS